MWTSPQCLAFIVLGLDVTTPAVVDALYRRLCAVRFHTFLQELVTVLTNTPGKVRRMHGNPSHTPSHGIVKSDDENSVDATYLELQRRSLRRCLHFEFYEIHMGIFCSGVGWSVAKQTMRFYRCCMLESDEPYHQLITEAEFMSEFGIS